MNKPRQRRQKARQVCNLLSFLVLLNDYKAQPDETLARSLDIGVGILLPAISIGEIHRPPAKNNKEN